MRRFLFYIAAMLTVLSCQKSETSLAVPDLSVDQTEVSVTSDGSVFSFQVTTKAEWKITSSASWISFDPESGKGNGTVTVTVSANEAYKERSETFSVNCYARRASVSVRQEAAEKPEEPADTKILEIKSVEDFVKFASDMDRYESTETVKLAADITISAPADSLMCNFDGQNHTISLTYEAKEVATAENPHLAEIGIFRKVSGTVKNLKTEGSITAAHEGEGTYHVGGIAGCAAKNSVFQNCTNGMLITVNNNAITHYVGGIVGFIEPGVNIIGCKNTGKVAAVYTGSSKASQVGGIVGHIENSVKTSVDPDPVAYDKGVNCVEECVNDGEVSYTGGGTARIGGICGFVNNLNDVQFKACTNNGAVKNDATGYTASSWAYVAGIVGYYGTPLEGGHALYEGCTNNGAITCNAAGTKLRARVAGINAHAGNSGQNPDADGNGINTWEFKTCTNNGDVSLLNGSSSARAQIGGIQAYCEPAGTVKIDGCTSNGKLTMENAQTQGKFNAAGALLGGNGAVNCSFTNNVVTDKVVIKVSLESACAGLIVGINNPYKTAVTGKVGAATIIKGATSTVVSSSNFTTLLFGSSISEGTTIEGVTFGD